MIGSLTNHNDLKYNYVELSRAFGYDPVEIGSTAREQIFSINKVRVFRYLPTCETRSSVFILPSMINRSYVLDLSPERSLVRYFVDQGIRVYILEWGNTEDEDRYIPFENYAKRYLKLAVESVREDSPHDSLHFMGHCLGGTLGLIYTSIYPEDFDSMTLITTPVDFSQGGLLGKWTQNPNFDVRAFVEAFGNAPWPILQASFQMIKPSQWMAKVQSLWERKAPGDKMIAMEVWSNDNVSVPGKAFFALIENLYRNNELFNGQFYLEGQKIELGRYKGPIYSYAFEEDHVVPPQASLVLNGFFTENFVEEVPLKGGHIGGLIGSHAAKSLWPQLVDHWDEDKYSV